MEVVLIGCVSGKLNRPARARDLYTSPLFVRRRLYAQRSTKRWAILSALYGLVQPDDFLRPYDLALTSLTAAEREEWGARVRHQFVRDYGTDVSRVEIHAGGAYVRAFGSPAGVEVAAPLSGLSLGRQLAWYNRSLGFAPRKEGPS